MVKAAIKHDKTEKDGVSFNLFTGKFTVDEKGGKTAYSEFKDMPDWAKESMAESKNDLLFGYNFVYKFPTALSVLAECGMALETFKFHNLSTFYYGVCLACTAPFFTLYYKMHDSANKIRAIPEKVPKKYHAAEKTKNAPVKEEKGNYRKRGFLALRSNYVPTKEKEEFIDPQPYDGSPIEVIELEGGISYRKQNTNI